MKHLFYCATIALALTACGGKDDEQTQEYTSFVITIKNTNIELPNVVSGYIDSIGFCRKIAEHGDIVCTSNSETTTDEVILDVDIDSIYVFTDYLVTSYRHATKTKHPFPVKKNRRNTVDLFKESVVEVLKTDSTQYPH